MRPANVFQLEMAGALSGPRALLMRLGFTLLIGGPFAVIAMPTAVRSSGLMMLVLFTSFFGAAVGLVRKRTEGQLERLSLLPRGLPVAVADIVLAGAALDVLQVLPVLVLAGIVGAPGLGLPHLLAAPALLLLAAVPLNLLGVLLGLILRSNAEVHLAAALSVGVLALFSGIVPVPGTLASVVRFLAPGNPLVWLRLFLETLFRGGPHGMGIPGSLAILAVATALGVWRSVDWAGLPRVSRSR